MDLKLTRWDLKRIAKANPENLDTRKLQEIAKSKELNLHTQQTECGDLACFPDSETWEIVVYLFTREICQFFGSQINFAPGESLLGYGFYFGTTYKALCGLIYRNGDECTIRMDGYALRIGNNNPYKKYFKLK